MIQKLFHRWIKWRYGGLPYRLPPPIRPACPLTMVPDGPMGWVLIRNPEMEEYRRQYRLWKIENYLYRPPAEVAARFEGSTGEDS
jgi:hypothetical protein